MPTKRVGHPHESLFLDTNVYILGVFGWIIETGFPSAVTIDFVYYNFSHMFIRFPMNFELSEVVC